MRRLVSAAARLYPRIWRVRYGTEFDALIADSGASVAVLLDILQGALRAHLQGSQLRSTSEGDPMSTYLPSRHAGRFALVALVIVLPTAVLITSSMLKYGLGVPGPFDVLEPTVTPWVTHPLGETVVILAPYAGLLLATLPVTRLRLGHQEGRLQASVQVSAPALSLVVGILSAGLIAVMAVYYLIENY